MRKLTTEIFINKAIKIHGGKYDYSLVEYQLAKLKVKIICKEHGVFEQTPDSHLHGQGCPFCCTTTKSNTVDFIKKSLLVHGYKYDYSLVDYKTNHKKVKIICKEHGIFLQTPAHHTQGEGCPKCKGKNKTTEDFIIKSKEIHSDKYDYSLVDYKLSNKKVKIICKEHGIFEQTPNSHLSGHGCPSCYKEQQLKKWHKNYKNGILYLLECWNDEERFLKIGLTSKTIKERYSTSFLMPYNFTIIKEIKLDSKTCWEIEQNIIKSFNNYTPLIHFGGRTECLQFFQKEKILEKFKGVL